MRKICVYTQEKKYKKLPAMRTNLQQKYMYRVWDMFCNICFNNESLFTYTYDREREPFMYNWFILCVFFSCEKAIPVWFKTKRNPLILIYIYIFCAFSVSYKQYRNAWCCCCTQLILMTTFIFLLYTRLVGVALHCLFFLFFFATLTHAMHVFLFNFLFAICSIWVFSFVYYTFALLACLLEYCESHKIIAYIAFLWINSFIVGRYFCCIFWIKMGILCKIVFYLFFFSFELTFVVILCVCVYESI